MSIQKRKKDHVELTVNDATQYRSPAGFEHYRFKHQALPEVDFDEVDTSASFLGRTFSFPLFISSMTGGYSGAGAVNALIAEFCERHNLPFGVGSQRAMLENSSETESFAIVRKHAPNAFICSNIGGAQLIGGLDKEKTDLLVNSIQADAVIVHLNPLQELMQPEGDRNFKGILKGIEHLVQNVGLPVIVKETGAGISADAAESLLDVGVQVIDVSGSGGTSWSKVENQRSANPKIIFDEWGIPTVECLEQVVRLKKDYDFLVIASGGIRNALDIGKSLCLGADMTAIAQPVIKAIHEGGMPALEDYFSTLKNNLKIVLTLIGKKSLGELSSADLLSL